METSEKIVIDEDFMIYIRLAFEYGVVFTESARNLGKDVNGELVAKMEEVINGEFPGHTPEYLATHMVPFIMAALEPKDKVEKLPDSTENKTMKGTKKGGKKGGKGDCK